MTSDLSQAKNRQSRRSILKSAAAVTLLGTSLAGCQGSSGGDGSSDGEGSNEDSTIHNLGAVGPMSGAGAGVVAQALTGIKIQIDRFNEDSDNINFNVLETDASLTAPDETVTGIRELKQGNEVNMFHTWFSPLTLAAFPLIKQENALLITSATSQPLIDADYPNLLIDNMWAEDQAVASALYNSEELGWSGTVAFISTNDQYGNSMYNFHKKHLKSMGVSNVQKELFVPGTQDFTNFVSRLKSADIDGLIIGSYQPYVGSILSQAAQIGWNIPRGEGGPRGIGTFGTNDPTLLDQVDVNALNGWTVVDGPSPTSTPETQELNARYKEIEGISGTFSTVLAYMASEAITGAVAETGTDPTENVKPIRENIGERTVDDPYEILGLKVFWDSAGRMRAPFSIAKWDGGETTVLDRISTKTVLSHIE